MLPGNASYIIANTIRITNILDVAALQTSFNEIVRRHESLRTTFASIDGVPMQVITEDVTFPMPLIDLTHVGSVEDRWEQARQLANQEAAQSFDLVQGPLIRLTLIRIDLRNHLLLLTMHHIISDGWSVSVFMHELAALYEAFTQGQASPLPENGRSGLTIRACPKLLVPESSVEPIPMPIRLPEPCPSSRCMARHFSTSIISSSCLIARGSGGRWAGAVVARTCR